MDSKGYTVKQIKKIKEEGLPYRDQNNPAIKPILARIPQDASSIQKALGIGGACKACNLFCHACLCTSYGPKSLLLFHREGRFRCRRFCLSKTNGVFPKKCVKVINHEFSAEFSEVLI